MSGERKEFASSFRHAVNSLLAINNKQTKSCVWDQEFDPSHNGFPRLWKLVCTKDVKNSKQAPSQKSISARCFFFVISSVALFTLKQHVTEAVLYELYGNCLLCLPLILFVYRYLVRASEKMLYFKYWQYFCCNNKNIHMTEGLQQIYINLVRGD